MNSGIIYITEAEKAYLQEMYEKSMKSGNVVMDTEKPNDEMNVSWERLDYFMENLFKKYKVDDKEYAINFQSGMFEPLSIEQKKAIAENKDPNNYR